MNLRLTLYIAATLLAAGALAQPQVKMNWLKTFTTADHLSGMAVTKEGHVYGSQRLNQGGGGGSSLVKVLSNGQVSWERPEDSGGGVVFADILSNALVDVFPTFAGYDPAGVLRYRLETVQPRLYAFSMERHALYSAWIQQEIPGSGGPSKIHIRRIHPETGETLWTKLEAITPAAAKPTLIKADALGNVYVNLEGTASQLLKLNESGAELFRAASPSRVLDVATYRFNGVDYTYSLDFAPAEQGGNNRINKLSATGQYLWSHLVSGFGAEKLAVDPNTGAVYATGTHGSSVEAENDTRLLALNASGSPLWTKIFGKSSAVPGVKVDEFGRVYAFFTHASPFDERSAAVHAFRPNGDPVWTLQQPFANKQIRGIDIGFDQKWRLYWGGHTNSSTWYASYLQAPVAIDDSFNLISNKTLAIQAPGVLRNDQYTANARALVVTGPTNGTVDLRQDGGFFYTVKPGFNGIDRFTYKLNNGLDSFPATVSISVSVNWLKSFALAKTSVIGGDATTGTVTLTKGAAPSTFVSFASNSSAITVPANIAIASGSQTGIVQIKTSPVSTTVTRTVTASYDGVSKVAALTLTPGGLTGNVVSPSSVTGGNPTTGTLTLSGPAPAGGRTVTLTSNSSSLVVPSSVTVPEGTATAKYNVQTNPLAQPVTRQITARLGAVAIIANVTILPAKLSRLSINPSTVKGGTSTTGTVTLNAKTAANLTVNLSSNSSAVVVPASVVVPAGATSQTFTISTKPVTATATRQVTAAQGGVTSTASVSLTP